MYVNANCFKINVKPGRIERILGYRHFGVIVHEKLTWKENCKRLCCTLSKYVDVMYKVVVCE